MKRGDKYLVTGRYFNANFFATVIVASVTHEVDWGAYIGEAPYHHTEKKTASFVAQTGCKLSEKDARHFFPKINLPYRP